MKHPHSPFLFILLLLGAASIAYSQKPQAPQPMPVAPAGTGQPARISAPTPSGRSNPGNSGKPLSSNHRIVFTGKSGDKALGELSLLTASSVVAISGPLDASTTPTSFEVSGTVEEREGGLIVFEYRIVFQVPVTTAVMTSKPNGPAPSYGNVQYHNHTCSGTLFMKSGKAYDILKAGDNMYSVMIAPEMEK